MKSSGVRMGFLCRLGWVGSSVRPSPSLAPNYDPTTTIGPQYPILSEWSKGTDAPWVEIYNPTSQPIGLVKYFVCRREDTEDCFWGHHFWESVLQPGQYVVCCWTEDSGCRDREAAFTCLGCLAIVSIGCDCGTETLRSNVGGRWFVDTLPDVD